MDPSYAVKALLHELEVSFYVTVKFETFATSYFAVRDVSCFVSISSHRVRVLSTFTIVTYVVMTSPDNKPCFADGRVISRNVSNFKEEMQ